MDTVDIMIHLHPELSADDRSTLVDNMLANKGVVVASFDQQKEHPHALMVVYNPKAIQGKVILEVARKFDHAATIVGM